MSTSSISVFYQCRDGKAKLIHQNVSKSSLRSISRYAASRFDHADAAAKRASAGSNFLLIVESKDMLELDVDIEPHLNNILRWIAEYDFTNPKPLVIEHVPCAGTSPVLKEVIDFYRACYLLGLHKEPRGDNLHSYIIEYMRYGTLYASEFINILEVLSFDTALVHAAMNHVMYCRNIGQRVPEIDQIKKYCEKHGLWEEMEDVRVKQWAKIPVVGRVQCIQAQAKLAVEEKTLAERSTATEVTE